MDDLFIAASCFAFWSWCFQGATLCLGLLWWASQKCPPAILFPVFSCLCSNIQLPNLLWELIFLVDNEHQAPWKRHVCKCYKHIALEGWRADSGVCGPAYLCTTVSSAEGELGVPFLSPVFCLSVGWSLTSPQGGAFLSLASTHVVQDGPRAAVILGQCSSFARRCSLPLGTWGHCPASDYSSPLHCVLVFLRR